MAVANKVIILSGATTYFLCQTNQDKQPKEGNPTGPLESILTCVDIYSDRTSPKKKLLKHQRTKEQLTLHLDQVEKFETH